jgi:hypothetical protein
MGADQQQTAISGGWRFIRENPRHPRYRNYILCVANGSNSARTAKKIARPKWPGNWLTVDKQKRRASGLTAVAVSVAAQAKK